MSLLAHGQIKTRLILPFSLAMLASIAASILSAFLIFRNPGSHWQGPLVQSATIAIFLAWLFSFLSKNIFQRLKTLESAAVEQIEGNLNARVQRKGPADELDFTAQALNRLFDVVSATKAELLLHQTALQESANNVYITDRLGRIIWVNRAFTLTTGYELIEAFMQTPRLLKSGRHGAEVYQKLWRTIQSGQSFQAEMTNQKKDGTHFPHGLTITPVRTPTGEITHFIAIAQDITQQKETEAKMLQQKELIHSSKMAALGEMAGGIAHELNTPLGAIMLEAEMILESPNESGPPVPGTLPRKKMTDRALHILQITEQISKIIGGLRAFAREGTNDPLHPNSIRKIIHDTLSFCNEKLRNMNIDLTISEIPEDLMIDCRPPQISQVILTLLNNARDAIQDLDEKWIKISVDQTSEAVMISVTDSGKGIPEAVRAKVFQPFFTTKEIGKGTGLGLSISKGIIDSHAGCFFIDEASENTRFVVQLPKYTLVTLSNTE